MQILGEGRLGRSSPCVFGRFGSYLVRVEISVDSALIFNWRHGQRVYDCRGREVMRVMIHPVESPQVLLREPAVIIDAITNNQFSILPIERISLIVLDMKTGAVEIISLAEFVVWPAAHLKTA